MTRPGRACLMLLVLISLSRTASADPPRRHLFLDPAFIERVEGASLHVNAPARSDPVIRPDKPWEKLMISFWTTVLDEGGKLRMWYICRDAENKANLAYAESTDGLTWVKPSLGLVDYHGSTDNNLLGIHYLDGAVFRDPNAKSPDEAYVYIPSVGGKGMTRWTSPDGLRWRTDNRVILPFSCDTQNITFFDTRLGKYVMYLRGWSGGKGWLAWRRQVVRATTDDVTTPFPVTASGHDPRSKPGTLPHISDEFPVVFATDEIDPPNSDVYNISAQPYPPDPNWYVGFPSLLLREAGISDGRLQTQFIGSADGVAWHRYDRALYARPGLAGSESASMTFIGPGIVVRGDELWQYGTGFRSRHGDVADRKQKTDGVIYRYTQRLDGFVSLDFAPGNGGACTTAAVTVDGPRLLVNVDTGALGDLRVGVLDEMGNPIAGLGVEDCRVLHINSTHAAVEWKGGDLKALRGRQVKVVLRGSSAKVYGFYFAQ